MQRAKYLRREQNNQQVHDLEVPVVNRLLVTIIIAADELFSKVPTECKIQECLPHRVPLLS